jgi:serine/threonine protein kinase
MKSAANGSLTDHLAGRSLSHLGLLRDRTRQAGIICDIVLGMRYIHSQGVIHRDLKPDNVLIDELGRALICDFGLSRVQSPEGHLTANTGTFMYAAPEQWEPTDAGYTKSVDVYTFGLVAFEIIMGRLVFNSREPSQLRDLPPFFGPCMQTLIPRCCSFDPSKRPSFREIFDEFSACGWAILPDADAAKIQQCVAAVTDAETRIAHRKF